MLWLSPPATFSRIFVAWYVVAVIPSHVFLLFRGLA